MFKLLRAAGLSSRISCNCRYPTVVICENAYICFMFNLNVRFNIIYNTSHPLFTIRLSCLSNTLIYIRVDASLLCWRANKYIHSNSVLLLHYSLECAFYLTTCVLLCHNANDKYKNVPSWTSGAQLCVSS